MFRKLVHDRNLIRDDKTQNGGNDYEYVDYNDFLYSNRLIWNYTVSSVDAF